jgi:hypothetical protein
MPLLLAAQDYKLLPTDALKDEASLIGDIHPHSLILSSGDPTLDLIHACRGGAHNVKRLEVNAA